jgi:hypothetical protein
VTVWEVIVLVSLEGFQKIHKKIKKIQILKNPKFIFFKKKSKITYADGISKQSA